MGRKRYNSKEMAHQFAYSFNNTKGLLKVVDVYQHEMGEKMAICECVEPHPNGHKIRSVVHWLLKDLRIVTIECFDCSYCKEGLSVKNMSIGGYLANYCKDSRKDNNNNEVTTNYIRICNKCMYTEQGTFDYRHTFSTRQEAIDDFFKPLPF